MHSSPGRVHASTDAPAPSVGARSYDARVTITAAADGSALGNPGPAGWAWYIDDDRWDAGGWKHGTNNMGELKAVLELFRATEGTGEDLLVLCDSRYVIDSVVKWMPGWKRKGWRKADGKPVLNLELLQQIDAAIAGRTYRFEWVKGHMGHDLNEAADLRARAAATAYQRGAAVPSGPGFGGAAAAGAVDLAAPPVVGENGSLFDLEEDEEEAFRSLTVQLSADEWARLRSIADATAMPPEEALRSLLRG